MLSIMAERMEEVIYSVGRAYHRVHDKPGHIETLNATQVLWIAATGNFLWIFVMAFLGWATGSLSFGNGLYMAVCTFTTVGLGDYAPPFFDKDRSKIFKAVAYVMFALACLFGLSLLSALLGALETSIKEAANKVVDALDGDTDDEDESHVLKKTAVTEVGAGTNLSRVAPLAEGGGALPGDLIEGGEGKRKYTS